MDIDLILRLGTLALGAVATSKLLHDWINLRQGKLREEYRFAKDFLADLRTQEDMHPFQRQKGFQAIAGDATLSAGEIEYLLTLHDSARALKDYVLGRQYLKHFATASGAQIAFASKYDASWPRLWRKVGYFVLYFSFFTGAFSPMLLPALKVLPAGQALSLFFFTFLLFFPAAVLALIAGVRIARAEVLVKNQHKHSRGILLG